PRISFAAVVTISLFCRTKSLMSSLVSSDSLMSCSSRFLNCLLVSSVLSLSTLNFGRTFCLLSLNLAHLHLISILTSAWSDSCVVPLQLLTFVMFWVNFFSISTWSISVCVLWSFELQVTLYMSFLWNCVLGCVTFRFFNYLVF